jgi:hypothetical protein
MAYFIRRCGDEYSVIEIHPDDREETVASGLLIGDAEDLCARKIEAARRAAAPLPMSLKEGPQPSVNRRRSARQLAFKF